jgi:hypothetical protein
MFRLWILGLSFDGAERRWQGKERFVYNTLIDVDRMESEGKARYTAGSCGTCFSRSTPFEG